MTAIPQWLALIRADVGLEEVRGPGDNPAIVAKPAAIAGRFPGVPGFVAYCGNYNHDDTAWCGLEAADVISAAGYMPPFDRTNDYGSFLWADAWKTWGVGLTEPRVGAILCFGGHVAFLNAINDDGSFDVIGGNQTSPQGGAVTISRRSSGSVAAMRWPAGEAATPTVPRAGSDLLRRMGTAIINFEARRDGAGHLAVYALPAGDGGGTYEVAGINDRYHPIEAAKLKGMVAAGQFDDAEKYVADFIISYTNGVGGWSNNPGVEFYLRDCAFNRGPTGAARILQRAVGVAEDGEVGPITLAATRNKTPDDLLNRLRSARESYERSPVGRNESSQFWKGLVNRWNGALTIARQFSKESDMNDLVVNPSPQPNPGQSEQLDLAATIKELREAKEALAKAMAAVNAQPGQGLLQKFMAAIGGASGGTFWTGLIGIALNIALNAFGVVGGPVGTGATVVGQLLTGGTVTTMLGGLFAKISSIAKVLSTQKQT